MKKYKFGSEQIGITPQLLKRIVTLAVTESPVTRSSLASQAETSAPTVGKVLSAMENCKYFTSRQYSPEFGKKPCNHYTLNDALSILVLDLSSSVFSMSIISGYDSCAFFESYAFDPTMDYFDNLIGFLSRFGKEAARYKFGINEICIICNDESKPDAFVSPSSLLLCDKHAVNETADTVYKIFGRIPNCIIGENAAIGKALEFGTEVKTPDSAAYLYFGNSVKAFYRSQIGDIIPCNPKDLVLDQDNTLGDAVKESSTDDDFAYVVAHALNLMHCAFSPSTYIIEYDSIKFNDVFLSKIKRSFALIGKPLPEISPLRKAPGLAVRGAAKISAIKSILTHITPK